MSGQRDGVMVDKTGEDQEYVVKHATKDPMRLPTGNFLQGELTASHIGLISLGGIAIAWLFF